ncbi:hypothetical protein DEI91_04485 [Curtobacterium sp. MCBD17_032]|nr:hypothetical protein DEI91_04485 [Curtobacterium sp. MCBD17_032]
MDVLVTVVVVIVVALVFDFTNGFHDTANAMATSVAMEETPRSGTTPRAATPRRGPGCRCVLRTLRRGRPVRDLVDHPPVPLTRGTPPSRRDAAVRTGCAARETPPSAGDAAVRTHRGARGTPPSAGDATPHARRRRIRRRLARSAASRADGPVSPPQAAGPPRSAPDGRPAPPHRQAPPGRITG